MIELKKNQKRGLIGTVVFHAALFIFFLFSGLSIPLPFPPEEISLPVQLALGNTDMGSGDVRPESTAPAETVDPLSNPEESVSASSPEEIETQESESEVSMPVSKAEKPAEKPKELDAKLKSALNNSFQTDKNNTSPGQGSSDSPGTFGKPDGSPDGKSLNGDKNGGGTSYKLGGRTAKNIGRIPGNWQEQGVINIEVFVNRNGDVVRARDAQGTTIVNAAMVRAAIEEAKKIKFTPKMDAPEEQRGIVTYDILLQ